MEIINKTIGEVTYSRPSFHEEDELFFTPTEKLINEINKMERGHSFESIQTTERYTFVRVVYRFNWQKYLEEPVALIGKDKDKVERRIDLEDVDNILPF